jgi:hypothetical protein
VGLIVTIASLIAIAAATLTPETSPAMASHFCLVCGSVGTVDAVLNVILFIPLGVGLALSGVQGKKALMWVFALSALIETAQLFFIPGRDSTIGDVLTNTLGGGLGFAIVRFYPLWLRPASRVARNLCLGWASIWLTIQIVSIYGFTLSLSHSQYFGEIARELGDFAVFPGRVLSVRIDDKPIPNTAIDDSRVVERLLLRGATIATTVVPAESTRKIAPIVRVADAQQREILLIAQDGDRFIFTIRTGAAVLRARRPFFAVAGVFPAVVPGYSSADDSLTLTARYAAGVVGIRAHNNSSDSGLVIPINASLGWILWLPFQWLIEGTGAEHMISWIWMACLALPFGYWAFYFRESTSSKQARLEATFDLLFGVLLLIAGLIVTPRVFGLAIAPFIDWVATLAGLFLGYFLGSVTRRLGLTTAPVSGAHQR